MTPPTDQNPKKPTVSVLLPVRNARPYLAAALSSILRQTFPDFELLAIDDGSTDGSPEVLERHASLDPRLRIIREGRIGLTAALNRGLSEAVGEFVARMDADDIAEAQRLAVQAAYLDANLQVVAVGSACRVMDNRGRIFKIRHPPTEHAHIVERLLQGQCSMIHPSVMLRRAALEMVGAYDESFSYGQDYDLWFRLSEVGMLANLNDALVRWRQHDHSVTEQRNHEQLAFQRQAWRAAVRRQELFTLEEPKFDTWLQSRRLDRYGIARSRALSAFRIGELSTGAIYALKAAGYLVRRPTRLRSELAHAARRLLRNRQMPTCPTRPS